MNGLIDKARDEFGTTWDVLVPEEGRTLGWVIESVIEDAEDTMTHREKALAEKIAQGIEALPEWDGAGWPNHAYEIKAEAARIARELVAE